AKGGGRGEGRGLFVGLNPLACNLIHPPHKAVGVRSLWENVAFQLISSIDLSNHDSASVHHA
ncbi:MAG: hypothetical protein ACLQNE_29525, partial [Thermoguttaceae bacterium]